MSPGRRALSQTKVQDEESKFKDHWIDIAAVRYKALKYKGIGAQDVLKEVQRECFEETGKTIKLVRSTVVARAKGRRSIREFNQEKRWLTAGEERQVVDFTIELARRGFPLSHRRLKGHVDDICKGRHQTFPDSGVGKEWTQRFLERHSDELRPYWSRTLDNSRARAVNPTTKDAYFNLLEETIRGEEGGEFIAPDCIYGMDETGLQEGIGVSERVIGPTGQKVQYQQRSGGRENITVLVTICADGTSTPPAVIFKGEAFQSNWKQDNPLQASLGYSKKGYTDGAIGAEWIKQFDKHTKTKADGRRRLLLVDGHASHYTYNFLKYARDNHIHILCYPSHSTHIYQGLDVVIFGALKRNWASARDNFERAGQKVTKSNFLAVYAQAHTRALTPENIKAAFKKTGVVPFCRDVITNAMMAPSRELSSRANLPLPQSTPVRRVARLLMLEAALLPDDPSNGNPESGPSLPLSPARLSRIMPQTPTRIRVAVDALTTTSGSYLLSPTPIMSHSTPPLYIPTPISPFKRRCDTLHQRKASTVMEAELLELLKEAEERIQAEKERVRQMQAAAILQNIYVGRVQQQLHGQEEKAGRPKKRKLFGDGMPKLLDRDDFFTKVTEFEAEQGRKAEDKAARKVEMEKYSKEMEVWTKAEAERKKQNAVVRAQFQREKAAWEEERDLAKQEKRRAMWTKPKQNPIEKPIPKPTKGGNAAEDEGEDEEDDGGRGNADDENGEGGEED